MAALRRARLFVGLIVALIPTAAGVSVSSSSAAEPGPPNVLIIVTDDQRKNSLAVMPEVRARMKQGGTRLSNFFVTTPYCCPSRATILTGQYAHNHGVLRQNGNDFDETRSIFRYLDDAGYRTALYGKFLNRWGLEREPSYLDDWAFIGDHSRGWYGAEWNINGSIRRVSRYGSNFIAARVGRFLETYESDRAPWLLYVAPPGPHQPHTAETIEEQYRRSPVPRWSPSPAVFEKNLSDKPAYVNDGSRFTLGPQIHSVQLRKLKSIDDMVEQIFAEMSRRGETRETLVFYLSDNGLFYGEHGLGNKSAPYTEAVAVPSFVRWPEVIVPGGIDIRLTANIDIAPTVLDAAGVSLDDSQMDGRSLLDASWTRDHLFLEYFHRARRRVPSWGSVRGPSYQYAEYPETGDLEYYDLLADPYQLRNLLGDSQTTNDPSAAEIARLHTLVVQGQNCRGTQGPVSCP